MKYLLSVVHLLSCPVDLTFFNFSINSVRFLTSDSLLSSRHLMIPWTTFQAPLQATVDLQSVFKSIIITGNFIKVFLDFISISEVQCFHKQTHTIPHSLGSHIDY